MSCVSSSFPFLSPFNCVLYPCSGRVLWSWSESASPSSRCVCAAALSGALSVCICGLL